MDISDTRNSFWVKISGVPPSATLSNCDILKSVWQAERQRKEDADAQRKAEDDAKKKTALSNMGSGYSSHLQRVSVVYFFSSFCCCNLKFNFIQTLRRCGVWPPWIFLDRPEERQEADWERKEEEDYDRKMQTAEHRRPQRGQAEVTDGEKTSRWLTTQ